MKEFFGLPGFRPAALDPGFAPALLRMVDRIIVMDNGRIVADGARDEILRHAASKKGDAA